MTGQSPSTPSAPPPSTPPPPPSPPAPDATASRHDRRLQYRVTLVGVVGALLGALIGGAATLLGAMYQQHATASSQLQSERQSSYVAYSVAMDNFDGDITGILLQARLGIVPTRWVRTAISDEATLQRTGDQVSILASPQLLRIVQEQQMNAEIMSLEAQAVALRMSDPRLPISPGVPAQSTLMEELSSKDLSFADAIRDYKNVARTDLGAN